jgi:hypothetical protein
MGGGGGHTAGVGPVGRIVALLPPALALGALAGALGGAFEGWHYLGAGVPLLLLDALRRWLAAALAAAAGFVVLYALIEAVLSRLRRPLLPAGAVTALATALAGAPLLALGGYIANRAWGIRPSELLET